MPAQYLAVIATVLAALIGAVAVLLARRPAKAELELVKAELELAKAGLELVDVDFYGTTKQNFQIGSTTYQSLRLLTADFKVRNPGRQPIVITSVTVECRRSKGYRLYPPLEARFPPPARGVLASSAEYGIVLPKPRPEPFVERTTLSQELKAGDTDRFLVHLSGLNQPEWGAHLYDVQFTLTYNRDQRVRADPVVLAFPHLPESDPHTAAAAFEIDHFLTEVAVLRAGFREWSERTGWPEPVWDDPPRARREIENLPDELWRELSHELRDPIGMGLGGFTEGFWQPQATIESYLGRAVVQIDNLSAFLGTAERVADRDGMLTSFDLQTYQRQLTANRSELVRLAEELRARGTIPDNEPAWWISWLVKERISLGDRPVERPIQDESPLTREEAERIAQKWITESASPDMPLTPLVHEFDLGYVVTAQQPPGTPRLFGARRGIIDRETGELSVWQAEPVEIVIERFRTRRAAYPPALRTWHQANQVRWDLRKRIVTPTNATHLTIRGRTLIARSVKSDVEPNHHDLVRKFLSALPTEHRVRGYERCSEAAALSDALHAEDARRTAERELPITVEQACADLFGDAQIVTYRVRERGDPVAGESGPPCVSCALLMRYFGLPLRPPTGD